MIEVASRRAAVRQKVKMSGLQTFFKAVFFLTFSFNALAIQASTGFETSFPKIITVDLTETNETKLQLTGHTIRKKFLLEIYTIAHYSDLDFSLVPDKANNDFFDTILNDPGTKQITLTFKRNLRAKQIQKALTEGIENNCVGDQIEEVQPLLAEFRGAINTDISKGDEFSLRWTKEGHLLAFFQGTQAGNFDSPLLAKLLWSMWFGEKAVVDRNKLVKEINIADNSIE